ncbi:MAG: CTP synthase [Candidatus Wildermuthbacteria bacterium RIFCSPLOWO2_02_FULL_47_9c]|uniref:CTP synthase n=2 Tax=Parcubacteria group TaxID=1794811 RepID=A0A837IQU0_9BACT|nr:MAG: CTP synthetase, CTP synthase [Candidatus Yanofskybacteria bacterium GW2011_GWC1_48_11]KKW04706.1 MAG: CTP synthetase [Parcubacteria group bacterium GW2011_GWB1_49_12]KKW08995.1 MAG: CTP synthetase [Parcubacteria group bacterium GW2011_GWA1_49_26]OHA61048.1 MAG: CTP synthase [Candidatus Wildermuthbacteria bacterium GWA1_49_26]OHA66031.1 MAG: CTP synthase [Candidatus Wildermuthbacteria bacterium RIFCSPHIGHO2_01_FULL_50_47]OHA69953.1 MAG: CTP synthase [Candidatus Wildermuthbacteria bacter
MTRFIFVAGGVISGVGKGVATASIAKILQSKGFRVSAAKIDPYVNVDAGTLNPLEHGEVFVTSDGTECDQDVGNYERFLDQEFSTVNYLTTGRVYQAVINRERNLEYDGKTVEVVFHISEEVILRLEKAAKKDKADFILVEVGGTVGDYQNLLFLEAARMMKHRMSDRVLFVLVTYLPVPENVGEMKTKPTQHAVRALNAAGIQPDIILARAKAPVDKPRKRKISDFCNVDEQDVISAPDVESIYEIPLNFEKDNLGDRILKKFGLKPRRKDLREWQKLLRKIRAHKKLVRVGIVGKYFSIGDFTLMDSYISVIESIKHAAWANNREPQITWLSAEKYTEGGKTLAELKEFDGIIVPGGFGTRGIEGKIKAIQFCREKKIPYLGLCLGLQLALIEFARNVCGLKDATSREFVKDAKTPVIDVMPDQKVLLEEKRYGGTMRLGSYPCRIKKGTLAYAAYGSGNISERHRHRYELNNEYREALQSKGMVFSGVNPDRDLVEIAELKEHPFFLGTQFHPEFKSRPLRPHPLFRAFIKASCKT